MTTFGIIAILIFLAGLVLTYVFYKVNSKKLQFTFVIVSIIFLCLFLFFKYPIEIYRAVVQGGIIPYNSIKGASNDTISKLFLLDICNLFSVIVPIGYILYYRNQKYNSVISFSIIGILGSLFTMGGTVLAAPYDLNASEFFKYIFVGEPQKVIFYLEHFVMGILSFNILLISSFIKLKIYIKTILIIGAYVVYVEIMASIFGLTQSISALGYNDFFTNSYFEGLLNINTQKPAYTPPPYKDFVTIFDLKNQAACVFVSWFFFILFSHIIILAKNFSISFKKYNHSMKKILVASKLNIKNNFDKFLSTSKNIKNIYKNNRDTNNI